MAVTTPFIVLIATQLIYEGNERDRVFSQAKAKSLELGKPLLNAGCGSLKPLGGFPRAIIESDINLDINPQNVPRFVQASIEEIPYPDKYFGAVFCGHALEHVSDWRKALRELERVTDHTYFIVPLAIWPSSWIMPGHKRVFVGEQVYKIR